MTCPKRRIWGEWEKLCRKAPRPALGLRAAHQLGILAKLFPPLETSFNREADGLCQAFDRAALEKAALPEAKQITLMLAALGAFLGRGGATELLNVLGLKTIANYNAREQVLALVDNYRVPGEFYARRESIADGELRRVATRCEPILLYHLTRALGQEATAEWFITQMRALGVESGPPSALLMGRHLLEMGLQPGRQIGEVTRAVYELQLDGAVIDLAQAQAAAHGLLENMKAEL